jgi:hypothetical protein
MYSSVTFGILVALLLVLLVIGCGMLASHFRPRRPRTEAHHGHPSLKASEAPDADTRLGD